MLNMLGTITHTP